MEEMQSFRPIQRLSLREETIEIKMQIQQYLKPREVLWLKGLDGTVLTVQVLISGQHSGRVM